MPLSEVLGLQLDAASPVFIAWEGMSMYFQPEVAQILGSCRCWRSPQSRLWVNIVHRYAVEHPEAFPDSVQAFMHGMGIPGRAVHVRHRLHRRIHGPPRTVLPRSGDLRHVSWRIGETRFTNSTSSAWCRASLPPTLAGRVGTRTVRRRCRVATAGRAASAAIAGQRQHAVRELKLHGS